MTLDDQDEMIFFWGLPMCAQAVGRRAQRAPKKPEVGRSKPRCYAFFILVFLLPHKAGLEPETQTPQRTELPHELTAWYARIF